MKRTREASEAQRDASIERFSPRAAGWILISIAGLILCLFTFVLWMSTVRLHSGSEESAQISPLMIVVAIITICGLVAPGLPFVMSEIRVGRKSLTWRTWRGASQAQWSEVLDFYEVFQPNRTGCVITTTRGDCFFHQSWPRAILLKSLVAEYAINARSKQWALLGARPEIDEWPKTFQYDTVLHRWGSAIWWGAFFAPLTALIICFGARAWKDAIELAAGMGWGWGIVYGVMAILLTLFPFAPIFMHCPGFSELRKRREQTITLSKDGIYFQDGSKNVEARWSEITGLTYGSFNRHYQVDTINGSFNFRVTIRDAWVLTGAIEAMASKSVPSGWKPSYREWFDEPTRIALDSPMSVPNHVFSYRTRIARIMLLGSLALWVAVAFIMVMEYFHIISHAFRKPIIVDPTIIVVLAGMSAGVFSCAWTYFAAGIQTTQEGMVQRMLFGSRRILWGEVAIFRVKRDEVLILSDHQRIRFSTEIADYKQLLAEIKSRTRREPEI